jgi:hypothetical protein
MRNLSWEVELQEFSSQCHYSPAASSRIPAMPNAEEEKRRRCRQKS